MFIPTKIENPMYNKAMNNDVERNLKSEVISTLRAERNDVGKRET